jgi:hypothetical protein
MWEDEFNASLVACPEAMTCIEAIREHFAGAGNVEIHHTGTDNGDLRIWVTNGEGKSRNLFRLHFVRSGNYFSCNSYWLPGHLQLPLDGCLQNFRTTGDRLPNAFNLYPTMNGASARLVAAIEAAIAQWLA